MTEGLLFWWSVVSTIIAIATTIGGVWLLCISIKQTSQAESEKNRKKDQVKIWMQDANGVTQGLTRIVQDNLDKRYSSTNDMANAVWAIQAAAFALYQSLYEERCVTEEEYRQSQIELRNELKKQQSKGNLLNNKPEDNKLK
jgi:Rps23 Pro-64 3,4-dihydroxylase Tpa1-like proline 4-hydroxylase